MALQCHCEAIENGRGNLKFSKWRLLRFARNDVCSNIKGAIFNYNLYKLKAAVKNKS